MASQITLRWKKSKRLKKDIGPTRKSNDKGHILDSILNFRLLSVQHSDCWEACLRHKWVSYCWARWVCLISWSVCIKIIRDRWCGMPERVAWFCNCKYEWLLEPNKNGLLASPDPTLLSWSNEKKAATKQRRTNRWERTQRKSAGPFLFLNFVADRLGTCGKECL